ncbi:monovalent cation/H+ antiporter subunit D [Pseudomonas matsuisoli]|uniref:Monovalent cation/H+ antiporter subunit D n=1 Tax=Pseudomonas matsuisoli TaxID=1515666 RepID=A0A917PR93_9PSED|nr:monovalent cation/H+ antiporter subunit D [Pseudomonas matsuisoli]GGJ88992.1 monovalent cation/H+ antiporter subunit D [Pseudomonas matsuisoli]
MNHLIILPILLPLLVGGFFLLRPKLSSTATRVVSLAATWALVPLAALLLMRADSGQIDVYALGGWAPPFGIVLMLDRLSALMLVVAAVLASFAVLYATRGDDRRGPDFHALFQFQLLGINGAFLTGDLFNLFVFFEILLIASYSLLLHGGGADRVRAGTHYVVLNLVGSSFFLIGIGTLYGLLGTLNMADLATKVASADPERAPLLAAAGFLLLVVFGLKGAILPLYFWLPRAYAASSAPVAALFAIMTKVGLYAIIRLFFLVFGSEAGPLANLVLPWLWPIAAVTLAIAVIGALAARDLRITLGYLVVVSVGTLLAGVALGTAEGLSAALFYLIHSTWVAGGLFLLADLVARQRGKVGCELACGPKLRNPMLLGGLFFVGAVSIAGLPPFSGFLGKVMLLQATPVGYQALVIWPVVLVGGLGMVIALARAGSTLFWRMSCSPLETADLDRVRLVATAGLLLGSPLLVVFAAPVHAYVQATARQLLDLAPYFSIVGGQGI